MRQNSSVNILMLIVSLAAGLLAYIVGEALLVFFSYLPFSLQCGIYLAVIMAIYCLAMGISEKIHSGNYILKKQEFLESSAKSMTLLILSAFVLGCVTQFIYGLLGNVSLGTPEFRGTMLVCDVSGSMLENDPEREAVAGMLEYVERVPLGEYLGIITYNEQPTVIREYKPLQSENERVGLKRLVADGVEYEGGTGTQAALDAAFEQIRLIDEERWPGLILLFSDGLSDMDYERLKRNAIGDREAENMVPVNTVYFSDSQMGGYQMKTIAQKTGGTYFYLSDDFDEVSLREAFTHSRSIFAFEKPHLLQEVVSVSRRSVLRIILQGLFLWMWGTLLVGALAIFLNNKQLVQRFVLPKTILAFIVAAIFTWVLTDYVNVESISRFWLVMFMCIILIPTYIWDRR